MPTTHTSVSYHIVFSTKDREQNIYSESRGRLHEYLGGTCRGLGAFPLAILGTEDHVHLLVGPKPIHRMSDFVRELKRDTSKWVSATSLKTELQWQAGYSAFSVSASAIPDIRRFISTQEVHHHKKSHLEELELILKEAGVDFDPRYLN